MADAKTQLRVLLRKWAFAVVWVTLPFTAGPALADTLDPRISSFRTVVSVALWVGWVVTLLVALVPRTVTLTAIRIVAPASVAAVIWGAAVTPSVGPADLVAIVVTALATAVACFGPDRIVVDGYVFRGRPALLAKLEERTRSMLGLGAEAMRPLESSTLGESARVMALGLLVADELVKKGRIAG